MDCPTDFLFDCDLASFACGGVDYVFVLDRTNVSQWTVLYDSVGHGKGDVGKRHQKVSDESSLAALPLECGDGSRELPEDPRHLLDVVGGDVAQLLAGVLCLFTP